MQKARLPKALGLLLIAISLIIWASCSPDAGDMAGTASITVSVLDSTSKTVAPEGNTDITHYLISLHNDAEDIHADSGYIPKGDAFSVSGVPAGEWYASAGAYVSRADGSYLLVASARTDTKRVYGNQDASFSIVLDSILDELSGDVSLSLVMPPELRNGGFRYSWTITGLGERDGYSASYASQEIMEASDGRAELVIPASDPDGTGSNPLLQGSYLIEFQIYDGSDYGSSTVKRMDADVMRLLSGEEAYGELDFHTDEFFQGELSITVSDLIGNEIRPETSDGETLYELPYKAGGASISISFSDGDLAGYDVAWYLDGAETEIVPSGGSYSFSGLGKGRHTIAALIIDPAHEMAVGSLRIAVEVSMDPSIGTAAPEIPDHTIEAKEEIQDLFREEALTQTLPVSSLPDTIKGIETLVKLSAVTTASEVRVEEGQTAFPDAAEHTSTVKRMLETALKNVKWSADLKEMLNGILNGTGLLGLNGTDDIYLPSTFEEYPLVVRLDSRANLIAVMPDEAESLTASSAYRYTVDPANPYFASVDGALYSKDMKILYSAPKGSEAFAVDPRTETIAQGAFMLDPDIREVDIRNVTRIETGAFAFCYDLETIDLSGVTEIGEAAFAFCYSLHDVAFSTDLREIPLYAFSATYSLDRLVFPESIESIGPGAFANMEWDRQDKNGLPRDIIFEGASPIVMEDLPFQWNVLDHIAIRNMSHFGVFGSAPMESYDVYPKIAILGDVSLKDMDYMDGFSEIYAMMMASGLMDIWISADVDDVSALMYLAFMAKIMYLPQMADPTFGELSMIMYPGLLGSDAPDLSQYFPMALLYATMFEFFYDEIVPVYMADSEYYAEIPASYQETMFKMSLDLLKSVIGEFGLDIGGMEYPMLRFESSSENYSRYLGSYGTMMAPMLAAEVDVTPVPEEMIRAFLDEMQAGTGVTLPVDKIEAFIEYLAYLVPEATALSRDINSLDLYSAGNAAPAWLEEVL